MPKSIIKIAITFTAFITLTSLYAFYTLYEPSTPLVQSSKSVFKPLDESNDGYLVYTPGCRILKLNPFDATVKRFYVKTPYKYNCGPKKTIVYHKENGVVSINETALFEQHGVHKNQTDCVFYPVIRRYGGKKPDDGFHLGKQHDVIFDLPIEDDFILIKCKAGNKTIVNTVLALTPLKPKVEERCKKSQSAPDLGDNLSVIIVGIDSISKLNFIRYFRNTMSFLRNNLSATELHGFTKLADNTYPNMIPFLTGRQRNHYRGKERRFSFFDDVDLVWKRYADVGYRTLFSEDAPNMGMFVLGRRGFQNPPADYYSRPYAVAAELLNMRHRSHCIGPKLEMQVYFDYLKSFVGTMGNRLFFAFVFMARLTHDLLQYAGYADKPSYELLTDLHRTGALNRSLLIFFSDHGIRFGGIRQTYIGKIEERMPFFFLVFPDWFLKKFPSYAANLKTNEHRLTTHFDVHATLLHLLELKKKRRMEDIEDGFYTLHGQSLLTEITPERTCKDASISRHWCTCQTHKALPLDDTNVRQAALAVIRKINFVLRPSVRSCAFLKLQKVLDARLVQPNEDLVQMKYKDFLITLSVVPSGAIFEATVQFRWKQYTVFDDISRINLYGNQSDCIEDSQLKKYCFCKNLLNVS